MGMGINQTRHDDSTLRIDRFRGLVRGGQSIFCPHLNNAIPGHSHGPLFDQGVVRGHGEDPSIFNQYVDRFHDDWLLVAGYWMLVN